MSASGSNFVRHGSLRCYLSDRETAALTRIPCRYRPRAPPHQYRTIKKMRLYGHHKSLLSNFFLYCCIETDVLFVLLAFRRRLDLPAARGGFAWKRRRRECSVNSASITHNTMSPCEVCLNRLWVFLSSCRYPIVKFSRDCSLSSMLSH
jgi:hypothetical protein